MKLFSPDSSHWYLPDGTPLHTVPSATGEPRATTLRDARKLGLLPSVTNIIGVIAKPELTSWLQEQAVVAALTLPRLAGEAEDVFARRVVADSQTARDGAAEFGTAYHAGAERIANDQPVEPDNPAAAWLTFYNEWLANRVTSVLWTERVLVNLAAGYAGTADLLVDHVEHGWCLVDLKTAKFPPPVNGKARKFTPYKSWCYQLAAYREALGEPVRCLNLMVNSREPSAPVEHVWSEEELQDGLRAFLAAHRLWVIEKGYDPACKGSAEMVLTA